MSINGMRFPAGVPPFPAAAGPAEAEAQKTGVPSPGQESPPHELSERLPARTREGAIPPRAGLAMLASVQAAVAGKPPAPEAIAAKVRHQVNAGKVALRGQHTDAVLRAALLVAARGLTALSQESRRLVAE